MACNAVIDISHHNGGRLRFDRAKADSIVGVVQKATQGEAYVDAIYTYCRQTALSEAIAVHRRQSQRIREALRSADRQARDHGQSRQCVSRVGASR